MRVLLVENIHQHAKELLEQNGFEVKLLKSVLSEEELQELLSEYQIVGIRSKTQINKKILLKNNHLKAICCFCIGTDQVDLATAQSLNIPVLNAPRANTRSVVEWVLGQMLSLSRGFYEQNLNMHKGLWSKSAEGRHEIRGKTLAIIGYGNIGSQLGVVAEALGMKVVFFDINSKSPYGLAQGKVSLKEALLEADFVSIHVPETELTRGMIAGEQLSWMKKSSYLLNSSRGQVVNIEDLTEAIDRQIIAGCALDVFPQEPSANHAEFHSALRGLKNVLLTSHVGGSTEEAQKAVSVEVTESLLRQLKVQSL